MAPTRSDAPDNRHLYGTSLVPWWSSRRDLPFVMEVADWSAEDVDRVVAHGRAAAMQAETARALAERAQELALEVAAAVGVARAAVAACEFYRVPVQRAGDQARDLMALHPPGGCRMRACARAYYYLPRWSVDSLPPRRALARCAPRPPLSRRW